MFSDSPALPRQAAEQRLGGLPFSVSPGVLPLGRGTLEARASIMGLVACPLYKISQKSQLFPKFSGIYAKTKAPPKPGLRGCLAAADGSSQYRPREAAVSALAVLPKWKSLPGRMALRAIPAMAAASNTALEPYVNSTVAVLAFVLAVTNILCPFMVKWILKKHPADNEKEEIEEASK